MMMAIRRYALNLAPLVLGASGIGVAIVLLREHLRVNEGGVADGLFCGGGGGFDCSLVAAHESSWMFGQPLALWGLFFYIVITALALMALLPGKRQLTDRVSLALVLAAVALDLWLAWVMVARIGSVCLNCVATYAINLLLVVVLWRLVLRRPAAVDAGSPAPTAGSVWLWTKAAIVGAAVAGGVFAYNYTSEEVDLVREMAVVEADEFLAQLAQAPAIDMARFEALPARGAADAELKIAVAGDFQCAYCRSLATQLEKLLHDHPDRIRVYFVNGPVHKSCNPLVKSERHKDACWLARAATCAAAEGKFWDYHDLIYVALPQLLVDRAHVEEGLPSIGLDRERVRACADSDQAKAALDRDLAILAELDLKSIPSLVINGYPERAGIYPAALRRIVQTMLDE
jgi:uncharacterized membrane protein/protein-disulfide isomerase